MTLKAYHVDERELKVGDAAGPDTRFFETLDRAKHEIEAVFERLRPSSKPKRVTAVFAFRRSQDAVEYAIKNKKSMYYEVEIADEDDCHTADWRWLGRAAELANDVSAVEQCADSYWKGKNLDDDPTIEILSYSAKVVGICRISPKEKLAYLERSIGTDDS